MSPIKGVYTWYSWREFKLFLPAVSATVQGMTVILAGHDTDYSSVIIPFTEYSYLFFSIKYGCFYWKFTDQEMF